MENLKFKLAELIAEVVRETGRSLEDVQAQDKEIADAGVTDVETYKKLIKPEKEEYHGVNRGKGHWNDDLDNKLINLIKKGSNMKDLTEKLKVSRTTIYVKLMDLGYENLKMARKDLLYSDGLTHREHNIIKLIAEGYIDQEIADELFLANQTVRHHIHSILKKLGKRNRTEIVIHYYKNMINEMKGKEE